ncbi:MAG TPA: signal peptidase I [Gemmatimonadales bacterium]|nr:signal peptidase I [Gemmatimonadales bacterium]
MEDSRITSSSAAGSMPRYTITEQQRQAVLRRMNRGMHLPLRFVWESVKSFAIAVCLFLVMRAFLVEAFKIPSGSMERTLLVGDFLLVNKLVYGAEIPFTGKSLPAVREPARGDVIVFQWPNDPSKNFVKRLVGLPGDTVAMLDGVLQLNGDPQVEEYVTHSDPNTDPAGDDFRWQRDYLIRSAQATRTYQPSRNNWGPIVVPDKHLFVLGDNRDNSLDSRYWGWVPDSLVRGQPLVVYYSYAPDTAESLSWLTNIRWTRLGSRVR